MCITKLELSRDGNNLSHHHRRGKIHELPEMNTNQMRLISFTSISVSIAMVYLTSPIYCKYEHRLLMVVSRCAASCCEAALAGLREADSCVYR
jgi:hypothetical protein